MNYFRAAMACRGAGSKAGGPVTDGSYVRIMNHRPSRKFTKGMSIQREGETRQEKVRSLVACMAREGDRTSGVH